MLEMSLLIILLDLCNTKRKRKWKEKSWSSLYGWIYAYKCIIPGLIHKYCQPLTTVFQNNILIVARIHL